ncbi:MAG: hypothetical protein Q8R91_07695 [Candidatus Omnitrophota bacterium]|nr:hypothetical protein [Candidatus Omnitrophota bacterium]
MRYRVSARFDRSVKRLDPGRKQRVQEAIDRLVAAFETGELPAGLGLKQLKAGLWELRAGLADRVLFYRTGDRVEFLAAGNHDDIKRLLHTL